MSRFTYLLVIAAMPLFTGCVMTVKAVNPRPNVAIAANVGKATVDVKKIADNHKIGRVNVHDFRQTLTRGFKNAVGSHYVTTGGPADLQLVFDHAEMRFGRFMRMNFLTLHYRARWVGRDGKVLAEVAGVAKPRNPTETGSRHLEDVVEVMYEKLVAGLKVLRHERPTHKPQMPVASPEA